MSGRALGEPPFGPAFLQAPRSASGGVQPAHRLVGVGAERAAAVGHELTAEYRTMTNAEREGDMLPSHLVDQMATAKLADPAR